MLTDNSRRATTLLIICDYISANRPLGYGRVYLPLHKVTDTPFHIQGEMLFFQEIHILQVTLPLRENSVFFSSLTK